MAYNKKTSANKPSFSDRQDSIYADVTAAITKSIQNVLDNGGTFNWVRPWSTATFQNAVSKKSYRGVNLLLLSFMPFDDPRYITFNQAAELAKKSKTEGFRFLKEGEKTCTSILFWGRSNEKKDAATGDTVKNGFMFLRSYRAFNVTQTNLVEEGLLPAYIVNENAEPFVACDRADEVIRAYVKRVGLTVREGGAKASFNPSLDLVAMPNQKTFSCPASWYRTFFHELIHSTGIASRLNRDGITDIKGFGTKSYADEELIAEIGSAMLAAYFGIEGQDQSAEYIGGWLGRLQNDIRLIEKAAGKAQKAVDLILNTTFGDNSEGEEEEGE